MPKYTYYLTVKHAGLEVTTAGQVTARDEKAAIKAAAKLASEEVVKVTVQVVDDKDE